MEIISLDIGGKFAHFRKYYANNTALSYTIPPRTTMMGMLAAILGRERDSYYEELASEKIKLGVRILSPLKKTFHRLNLLSIKSSDDFTRKGGRIQTPFEIVTGHALPTDWVVYRIFVGCTEEGKAVFEELKNSLLNRTQKFNLTLGAANFTASILKVQVFENQSSKTSSDWIPIHAAVPSNMVLGLDFEKDVNGAMNFLEEELLPADFVGNQNREVKKMVRAVYSTRNLPFTVKLSVPFYSLLSENEIQNIVFLD